MRILGVIFLSCLFFQGVLFSEDGVPSYGLEARVIEAVYEAYLASGQSSSNSYVYQEPDVDFYRERVPSPRRDTYLLSSIVESYESSDPDAYLNKPLSDSKYFAISHELKEDDLAVQDEGLTFSVMSDRVGR